MWGTLFTSVSPHMMVFEKYDTNNIEYMCKGLEPTIRSNTIKLRTNSPSDTWYNMEPLVGIEPTCLTW